MSSAPETIRVKPTHPSQGEWVVINKADYDPQQHALYEEADTADVPADTAATPAKPVKTKAKE